MRLIDADALFDSLHQALGSKIDEEKASALIEMINNAATIDPPPNPPLTQDELRGMDGEPVWCVNGGASRWGIVCVYGSCDDEFECYAANYERIPGWCYGMDGKAGWLAYRRKPEGVDT